MEPGPQTVPSPDRSFLYGHGVFETMLCIAGRIALLEFHRDRLREGAERLAIPLPEATLDETLARARSLPGTQLLRLHLSCGDGPRGYAVPESATARLSLQTFPRDDDPFAAAPPVRLCTARIAIAVQPALAGIKHCNRLEQVLAATEARERGFDDALMTSADGAVHCASSANVFALEGDVLRTPDCRDAGIRGTRRRLILEDLADRCELRVEEGRITADECRSADALILTNAGRGIRAVKEYDGRVFAPSDTVRRLQKAYAEVLRAC